MEKFYYDFSTGRIKIDASEGVYPPHEDSILLARTLEKISGEMKGKKILEMGCGSGFISILLSRTLNQRIFSYDVNPVAIDDTKRNAKSNNADIEAIQSDLFENVAGKYDFIIFNAPYLPVDDSEIDDNNRRQWSRNEYGKDIIERFINESKNHLEKNGRIMIVFSSLTGNVESLFHANGFSYKIIGKDKIYFEEIYVIEAEMKK